MKIQIKKASLKDASFFYELRNEKIARKNFFITKKIKYNDHLKWYKKKLRQKNIIFLIALINNSKKIGIVRYDVGVILANISINISKDFRSLGYGSRILKKSEKFFIVFTDSTNNTGLIWPTVKGLVHKTLAQGAQFTRRVLVIIVNGF